MLSLFSRATSTSASPPFARSCFKKRLQANGRFKTKYNYKSTQNQKSSLIVLPRRPWWRWSLTSTSAEGLKPGRKPKQPSLMWWRKPSASWCVGGCQKTIKGTSTENKKRHTALKVQVFEALCPEYDFSDETIQKIQVEKKVERWSRPIYSQGILETNMKEIRLASSDAIAMYAMAAMMEHSCMPNVKITFDKQFNVSSAKNHPHLPPPI